MNHRRRVRVLILLSTLVVVAQPLVAVTGASGAPETSAGATESADDRSDRAIRALRDDAQGKVFVSKRESTGVAGFIRTGATGDLLPDSAATTAGGKAQGFFARFGEAFGITDASQLELASSFTDNYGTTHLTYEQVYRGLPVFGAVLKVHVDAQSDLTAVNGVFVPSIGIGTSARLNSAQAARLAIEEVAADPPGDAEAAVRTSDLRAESSTLLVYRTRLVRDVAGSNQLAYEVVVTNGSSIRDVAFVHANAGKILNRYSLVHDALFRRLFEQNTNTQVWQEGDAFPGNLNQDQQNIVNFSGESYYYFFNTFGRDSWDGAGAEMRSVNNDPTILCPNANWNGETTNYCNGVTSDDVVAHEWGHAYTERTSNLIYQWQSGALNESYSDIWGETVDMINSSGTDTPNPNRGEGACSQYTLERNFVVINSPSSIAGFCNAAPAQFGPALTATGVTGNLVLVNDTVGTTSDGCEAFGGVTGAIALIDRGGCVFTQKVANAQAAGAIGVLIADNVWGPPDPLGGVDASITIPSVRIPLGNGTTFKNALAGGPVNVTMRLGLPSVENSVRWALSEDSTAFGTAGKHAIRDMWNPRCVSDPGRVTDAEYFCAVTDSGGVHTNSGVPNHGFALLVDGGTYNGHTIAPIGLVKAAHLYFQAQLLQTPTTDFNDHADALLAACAGLVGDPLNNLSTEPGDPGISGDVFTLADCGEGGPVEEMIAAVELRIDPAEQCNFQPVLQPGAPDACADTVSEDDPFTIYEEGFETGIDPARWTIDDEGVFAGREALGPFPWKAAAGPLPAGQPGAAAFAVDPQEGNCNLGDGDVSGHTTMTSAEIPIPDMDQSTVRMSFEHYVATEAGWDGGNLKVSINGDPFIVPPDAAYTFNSYNVPNLNPAPDNTNPLQGQDGWTGTDGGELTSSWGESQLNLAALGVVPGDTIQLQFDFGIDGCTGIDGWYVDNVHVYLCVNADPTIAIVPGGSSDGQRAATINIEVGDAETDAADLTLSGASDNAGAVANSGLSFGGSGADRTLGITGVPGSGGTAVVTITVRDEGGGTASVDVTVIIGGGGDDELQGTSGDDVILGGGGNDALFGLAGIDLLAGWNGNDALDGGDDDDTLFGGRGNDTLTGGTGADGFSGGQGDDVLTDFNAGEGDTGSA